MAESERASRPSRSGLYVAAVATLLALGVLIGVATSREDGPPAACVEALAAAEGLIDELGDGYTLIGQALEALSDFELDRAEDIANQLDPDQIRSLRADYDDKAKECRS